MIFLVARVRSFLAASPLRVDRGATAVEYALMVGAITLVIAVAAALLGAALDGVFDEATTTFTAG